ncbi:MAG: universal stress protein [Planctomycetes bacterium]|nr:universal stress protein [Planctomycetota bacterium]
MLRSILLGLDGSDDSAGAIELGVRWAKRFDCLLIGIGIVDEPTIRGAHPPGQVNPSYQAAYNQLLTQGRHSVEQSLEQFAIRCSEEKVACKLLEDEGRPCEKILTELQRYDLLMLGCTTHFRHGSERHPCKTLETVLRETPRPVIAVPSRLTNLPGENIVVAYDGSTPAARALQALVATDLCSLGTVQILTVHSDSSLEAARIAECAVEFLRFHNVEATRVPLVGNASAELILEHAQENHANLVVMGAYGKTRITEFLFGSTTCQALQQTSIPLLLYH